MEALRAEQNAAGKKIGAAKDAGERQRMIDEMKGVSTRVDELTPQLREIEERLDALVMEIPNIPDAATPYGESEDDNRVAKQHGEEYTDEWRKPHYELGEALDIIDFERGARLSGSRFYVLKGAGARLQRALIAFMLELHIDKHGYREMYLPAMVKEETMWHSGQLPKFRDNLYHDAEEDFWFVPTAEVPLTNMHGGEILEPGTLPLHYVAYTPCFRREKMSAGRDVRGIKRGHQFDKVEMYKFCEPEKSGDELESMLEDALNVCRALGFRYRVIEICTGDLGFNAARTYDVEVWAPGVGEWLEVSSVSNCSRLPGAAREHPLPARGRRQAGVPAHAQRLRAGAAAHDDRRHGELPARGRQHRRAGGAAAVHGRHGPHHRGLTASATLAVPRPRRHLESQRHRRCFHRIRHTRGANDGNEGRADRGT